MLCKAGDACGHTTVVQVSCLLPLPLCQNPVGYIRHFKGSRSKSAKFTASHSEGFRFTIGALRVKVLSVCYSSSPQSKILSWILDFERFSGNFLCVVSAGGFRFWILDFGFGF